MKRQPFLTFSFLLIAIIGMAGALSNMEPSTVLGLVIVVFVVFASFVQQDIAAVILILAMILSPEVSFAKLALLRDATVRLDDIVIITFFFSWLFKMAYSKNLSFVKFTPLNKSLLTYLFVAVFSTFLAFVTAKRINPLFSMFSIVKYLEYFLVYFMFTNIITSKKQIPLFMGALFTGAFIVSIYGFFQVYKGFYRITAPFEGSAGEANTFGGYLLIILGQTILISIKSEKRNLRIIYFIFSILIAVLISYTYSRASYFGFIALLLASLRYLSFRNRLIVTLVAAVVITMFPMLLPEKVIDRTKSAFSGNTVNVAPFLKVNTRDSFYNRIESIRGSIMIWKEHTLFGRGVATYLVDSNYFKVLVETGIFGVMAFLWILFSVFKACRNALMHLQIFEPETVVQYQIIVMGFLCAYIGLLVHAIGANTFILIRIMEPFWFLVAVIVKIPDVVKTESEEYAQSTIVHPANWKRYGASGY